MGRNMGEEWIANACVRKKHRWLFRIPEIADDGTSMLPPLKSARPNLTFKEIEVQHLNETIYFPSKPDWKPVAVTLYDVKRNANPVFDWIKMVYNPEAGTWRPSITTGGNSFKKTCNLELFDGCGETIERWVFENAWPQSVEWGELEMGSSDIVTVDLTLRYDRAYYQA